MGQYDHLTDQATTYGLRVVEKEFKSTAKGLIKGNKIGIRKELTRIEKACALAEEIGHYHTSVGDILEQNDVRNRKQELRARQWAYQCMIPLERIIEAHKARVKGRHAIAEYLEVTEEFLQAAINRYTDKFGLFFVVDEQYTILFDPLAVVERFVE